MELKMIGVSEKGKPGFKIQKEQKPPTIEAHLIHHGTGIPNCSVCGQPVNIQEGGCKIYDNCFSKLGV